MQNRGGYDGSRLVAGGANHSTVSNRADRAFVTGEFGIVGVDVDGLGEAAKCDQEDSQER
jgi:hypothetical protein